MKRRGWLAVRALDHVRRGTECVPFRREHVVAAVLAVALGACASGPGGVDIASLDSGPIPDPPFGEGARDVFAEGYDLVSDRYIEPVDIEVLAVDGLDGLSVIDPALDAERRGATIQVTHGGKAVHSFAIDNAETPDDLARKTFEAIEAMRSASPELGARKSEAVYGAFFDGMIASLDSYTRYASTERARENRAQRDGYGGIGIRIRLLETAVEIAGVMENTPAQRSGLEDGDDIVLIDGVSAANLELGDAVRMLRGPVGSHVRLTIERQGTPRRFDVDVERQHIVPPTVTYERRGDIGYLQITRFNQKTAFSLVEQLREIRNTEPRPVGLVLDLRDNPGGLLDQAVEVADIFLEDGPIITTHGRHRDSHQRYEASGIDYADGLPLVVLLNENSASASEIVGAALQDNGRAVVLGTTSYGKGTVQTVFRLPNTAELTLTWSRIFAPTGYVLHGLGVLPTICTTTTTEPTARLFDALRTDGSATQATYATWRRSDKVNDPARGDLRKVCPPHPKDVDPDYDVQAAIDLLRRPGVYGEALAVSNSQVAGR